MNEISPCDNVSLARNEKRPCHRQDLLFRVFRLTETGETIVYSAEYVSNDRAE